MNPTIQQWICLPADDVSVRLPTSMRDPLVMIMFNNAEAVDCAIAQLESLRELLNEANN